MSADAARLSSVGVVASTPAARELAHGQSTREASSSVHRRGFWRQQNHRLVLTRLVSRVAGAHCISGHHCILHCSSYCRTSENVLLTENGVNVGKRSEALRCASLQFHFVSYAGVSMSMDRGVRGIMDVEKSDTCGKVLQRGVQ